MRNNSPGQNPPAVILFGIDEKHRPHASFFVKGDLAAAVKAADLMGMQTVIAETVELLEKTKVAKTLPLSLLSLQLTFFRACSSAIS